MATIGQALTAPEAGWQRIEDDNINITYEGADWTTWAYSGYSSGVEHVHAGANADTAIVKFNFTGTKLRIISQVQTGTPTSIQVKVDGQIIDTYTQNAGTTVFQCLVYSKEDFADGEHYVELSDIDTGKTNFIIDAIEIAENGELLPYTEDRALPTMYLIQNGLDIYTLKSSFYKIGVAPVTKEMIDNHGSEDMFKLTQITSDGVIGLSTVGAMGTGNEFECDLTSDILNIVEVDLGV